MFRSLPAREARHEPPSPGSDLRSSPPSPRERGEGRQGNNMNTELGRKLASVALIIGMFVVWELLCLIFHVSDVVLPRPTQVFVTLWQRAPALWPHTVQTLSATMLASVLAVAIAVAISSVIRSPHPAYTSALSLHPALLSSPHAPV